MIVRRSASWTLTVCLALTGCNQAEVDQLKQRVDELAKRNAELERRIEGLEKQRGGGPSAPTGGLSGLIDLLGRLGAARTPSTSGQLDADLQRRMQRLMVESLERLARSNTAKDAFKSMLRALSGGTASCSTPPCPPASPTATPGSSSALVLELRMPPRSAATAPFKVDVVLTNNGTQPTLVRGRLLEGHEVTFEVEGQAEKLTLPVTTPRAGAAQRDQRLEPGGSVEQSYDLLKLGLPRTPGRYKIRAIYRDGPLSLRTVAIETDRTR